MPVSVWSTWFGVSGSSTSSRRSLEPQLPEKAAYCRTSGIFTCFYLNREPHLALPFSKVSEPPPLRRRGRPVGDTEGFILDDLERDSSRSPPCPHLQSPEQSVRPCCRASLGSITCFQLLGRKESGPLSSPPHPPPAPAPPLSVSVVEPRSRLQSPQTHRFTSLAELSALE